ncbi:methylated-DNA--[protein]-cysteine S-methyltransferase [Bacteroides sp.]|uniref:methylated-DNA--[protein]-cysteine S-methyltransferase n=1 Tax=Bacteroides sp. TaxID=29523 RepID=UPI00258A8BBF|nr:methylated-DNA--[protein]-cysteine S-methyltransferase [Bacteroides sp.]
MSYYNQIAKAIEYLVKHFNEQPSLDKLSQVIGVSPYHLQRLFTEWAGVSPKQFVSYLTVEALKKELSQSRNIIEASDKVGLSSASRAYDLMVNIESVTPGEYKAKGKGVSIIYGVSSSPFGECFLAYTSRGLCNLSFITEEESEDILIDELHKEWINATFQRNDMLIKKWVDNIFKAHNTPLNLCLKGTPFQIKVWKALLSIPMGHLVTYTDVAHIAGDEKAVRAVASAVGRNPISFIIPCHRVIRKEGLIGQYHWGSDRKACMIGWEKAKREIAKD